VSACESAAGEVLHERGAGRRRLGRGAGGALGREQPLDLAPGAHLVGDVDREVEDARDPPVRVADRVVPEVEPGVLDPEPPAVVAEVGLGPGPRLAGRVHAVEHLVEPLAGDLGERLAQREPRDVAPAAHAPVGVVDEHVAVLGAVVQRHGHGRLEDHAAQPLALGLERLLGAYAAGGLGRDVEHRDDRCRPRPGPPRASS
jgi:hypothetical protein